MTALTSPPPPPGRALPPDPGARRRAAVELGVLQGGYVLFLAPWFFLSIGVVMGAANWNSPFAAPLLLAWGAYPLVALVTTVVAWAWFAGGRFAAARWANRVPLVWVVTGAAVLIWVFTAG
ncbi:hypothetical protein [Blastococcus montanus]|uniref:hypothetical protein n=1 Tax=Blastococcus montanus TaxID=3144973 RepID=UPI00320A264B